MGEEKVLEALEMGGETEVKEALLRLDYGAFKPPRRLY